MSALPNSSLSVLMVDDDSFMLDFVSTLLRELGVLSITTAKDGQAGIAAYDRMGAKPNLILCDLHMPGQDGFQFMQMLGERNYGGGIALISGQENRILHSASLMAQFHQLHILGAMPKPVSSEELQRTIKKLPMSKEAVAMLAAAGQ
jgi:two-component system, chemotaxis family, chemotaxis protein CheY